MTTTFTIRSYSRIPVHVPVFYVANDRAGQGMIVDCSRGGWRIVGTYPVQVNMPLTLRISVPDESGSVTMTQARVQWVRGLEFGVEIQTMEPADRQRPNHCLDESSPASQPSERLNELDTVGYLDRCEALVDHSAFLWLSRHPWA